MWNRIKTAALLAGLSGILLLIGHLLGGFQGVTIALVLALAMNFIAYFYSDSIVLSLYRAQKLNAQEYPHIYHIVKELAHKMEIPAPKLWLIKTPMANAFATGRSPQHASVALTTGILSLLNQKELAGVLAHELSHVKNRDTLVGTVAATIATAIGYCAHMLQYATAWGSDKQGRDSRVNAIGMIIIALLMPIAATLMQLAISRSREYMADETGADCTHDPLALASALEKLHSHISDAHLKADPAQASTAPLFIVHPFTKHTWTSLFSTHPPVRDRIARLRQMYEKMF